ncbi:MAG: DUF2749 domain-containing protein [Pseudaminobacter sp.]|nr:DUF2749 domain-containing protein [Pseudaminobacter sp.]
MGATTLWVVFPQGDVPVAAEPAPPRASDDADRRQRAQKFLGSDADRDVRSGLEMKPRW